MCHSHHHRLCVASFGLAIGLTWAIAVLIMGLIAMNYHFGTVLVTQLGTIYVGYKATLVGSLIGAAWALLEGLIGGIIIALFYNLFNKCCSKACSKTCAPGETTLK